MNWVVSPVKLAVAPPGMMVIVGLDEAVVVFTVRTAVPMIPPDWAVIVVVPATPAAARPVVALR